MNVLSLRPRGAVASIMLAVPSSRCVVSKDRSVAAGAALEEMGSCGARPLGLGREKCKGLARRVAGVSYDAAEMASLVSARCFVRVRVRVKVKVKMVWSVRT